MKAICKNCGEVQEAEKQSCTERTETGAFTEYYWICASCCTRHYLGSFGKLKEKDIIKSGGYTITKSYEVQGKEIKVSPEVYELFKDKKLKVGK